MNYLWRANTHLAATTAFSTMLAASAFAFFSERSTTTACKRAVTTSLAAPPVTVPVCVLSSSSSPLSSSCDSRRYSRLSKYPLLFPPVNSVGDRFCKGDYYVWLYADADGQPTSWEKYTIVDVSYETQNTTTNNSDNDELKKNSETGTTAVMITITMSTKFNENDAYKTHHRMTVDLHENTKARIDRHDWKLNAFEYKDEESTGEWVRFGNGDNVQAFEEKFDIFCMIEERQEESVVNTTHDDNRGEDERTDVIMEYQRGQQRILDGADRLSVRVNHDVVSLVKTKRHGYNEAWYAPPEYRALAGVALLKYFEAHSFSLVEIGKKGLADPIYVNVTASAE